MAHEKFPKDLLSTQFLLSYELLLLLRWLVENDEEKLKKIITKAYNAGLGREIDKIDYTQRDIAMADNIQDHVLDFFGMLENVLMNTIHDQIRAKAHKQNLMPSVGQIDAHECNDAMVQCCLEKATSKIELNPQANPKELLYEEILRCWNPNSQTTVN